MVEGLKPPLHSSASPRDKEPKEIERLLKWQEERIARKLKGDYESAVQHLSEVINGNLKSPAAISAVRVEGARHTRESFLRSIIKPAISNHPGTTLEDVLHTTRRVSNALRNTDIFSSLDAYIDRPQDPLADPDALDVVFRTKERGRLYFSSSTELGSNEASWSATGRLRNVFGGAETFEGNASTGTKTKRAFRGTFTVPLTSNMNTTAELSGYGIVRDLTTYASCFEDLRGLRGAIRHGSLHTGLHEFAYDVVVRHITSLTPTASMCMREAAGISLKSSVSHTLKYDSRDDPIAATRGVYGRLFHELAGLRLGGDAQFYKIETEGQLSRKLGNSGVSISLAAKSGLLWGFGERPQTLFSDRFQLGGPTSIRSFKMNSMGPKDGDDSMGGQLYYAAGLSLISDIPKKAHWPVKLHAWLNGGRLDEVDQELPLKTTIVSSLSRPSVSVGLGLISRFDPVRVEVNFGVPLLSSKSDGAKRGLQVGIGLEYM